MCHALVSELSFLCRSMKSQENQATLSIEGLSVFAVDGFELTVCPLTAEDDVPRTAEMPAVRWTHLAEGVGVSNLVLQSIRGI